MDEQLDLDAIEARSYTVVASSQSPWRQIQLDLRALVAELRASRAMVDTLDDEVNIGEQMIEENEERIAELEELADRLIDDADSSSVLTNEVFAHHQILFARIMADPQFNTIANDVAKDIAEALK